MVAAGTIKQTVVAALVSMGGWVVVLVQVGLWPTFRLSLVLDHTEHHVDAPPKLVNGG